MINVLLLQMLHRPRRLRQRCHQTAGREHTEGLLEAEREHTRKLVHEVVEAVEQRLTKKIETSQEDTIEVLKELIHTGYNMHEERISHIEEHLDIPHPKEN